MGSHGNLHTGPCRDCGVDIGTSTRSARRDRRCSACYNRNQRQTLRAARVSHGPVSRHRYGTIEAETTAELRAWTARMERQRAADVAAIEAVTDEYRGAGGERG